VTQDLSAVAWPVSTERLAIRPAAPDDIDGTWRYRQLPGVCEWLPRAATTLQDYAAAFVEPMRLERTLVVEHQGVVVGDLYLHLQDAWAQAEVSDRGRLALAEIGWVLDPAFGGRGLATEAVAALIAICFDDLDVHRVKATCIASNTPSWRLMDRLGMRREGHTVRDALHRTKGWLDGYHYGLLVEEWRGTHGLGGRSREVRPPAPSAGA
jgi:RimJ/RimL family protein N-acetyltransferase